MRHIVLAFVIVGLALPVLGSSSQPRPDSGPTFTFTLRVTSPVAGKEVVFTGAVLVAEQGAKLIPVSQKTPFDLNGTGRLLNAMFKAADPDGKLAVDISTKSTKSGWTGQASGTGNAVIVGQNMLRTSEAFAIPL